MKPKNKKGGFFSMLLGTLGASLLGNILAGKGGLRGLIPKRQNGKDKIKE